MMAPPTPVNCQTNPSHEDCDDDDDTPTTIAPGLPGSGGGTLKKPEGVTYTPTEVKGSVTLTWKEAENATGYEVWYEQCGLTIICNYVKLNTTALGRTIRNYAVSGLDTERINEEPRLHKFKIRALKGTVEYMDSDEIIVNLYPAPQNLEGFSRVHGQVTLTWDPVPNKDVNDDPDTKYHVEQNFPIYILGFRIDDWERLPHEGVNRVPITFDISTMKYKTVVSGLTVGETYEYRIKADSAQGKSDASKEKPVTVANQAPTTAPTITSRFDMIGYRGVQFQWTADVPGATSYLVKVTSADPFSTDDAYVEFMPTTLADIDNSMPVSSPWTRVKTTTGTGAINVVGLVPDSIYSFTVKGENQWDSGPEATSAAFRAAEPTHYWGHQHDHSVGYSISKDSAGNPDIGVPGIDSAILTAITEWNARMNYDLEICDISTSTCSDMHIATIKTVAPASKGDNVTGCGPSYACVRRTGDEEDPSGVGRHMTDMDVIFENIANSCASPDVICPTDEETTYEWTDNYKDHNKPAPMRPGTSTLDHRYIYGKWVVLHELGHTLGLPDFYGMAANTNYDSRLASEKAIMNDHVDAETIQDEDIAQLDAIYRIHPKP